MASPDDDALILAAHKFVKDYMSHNDSSHDYNHILRVVTFSDKIHAATLAMHPFKPPDYTITTLVALLHDVGDKKYHGPTSTAEQFLLSVGCDPARAALIQKLVENVSYSNERAHPDDVARLCVLYPELPIVQDADRLDAIGAVGIGRAFTFGAVKKKGGMDGVIAHFEDKLLKLEAGMKTIEGKILARERGERVRLFKNWWTEEMHGVLKPPV